MFGLDYMIFRPHNVYGPRQNIGDRYRNVVGIFMNQILQDQPMTIFGDGTQTRAFSYIDDVAPVMAAAIDEPRGVEPGVQRRRRSAVAAERARRARRRGDGRRAAHRAPAGAARSPRTRTRATTRSQRVLRRRDATSLDDGLRAMAAWVKQQGARSSPPFEGIEVTKNLPPSWRAERPARG